MRRREFIWAAGGAAATWPGNLGAQRRERVYRIAVLTRLGPQSEPAESAALRQWRAWDGELRRLGYVEGKNLVIDRRSSEGDPLRVRALVAETIRTNPDVIFAPAHDIVAALRAATTTIPVVAVVGDPVSSGFAASLARPGGNITGFSVDVGIDSIKRLALLKEAVPTVSRIAWLGPRVVLESRFGQVFRENARAIGATMIGAPVDPPADEQAYRRAFAGLVGHRADSFSVSAGLDNLVHRRLIVALAAAARLPGIYWQREYVDAGGLMAYDVDTASMFRGAAGYVDRILKGANPAELPFQQPTKFELVLNLKAARMLGLTIPESLLARADAIIE